MRTDLPNNTLMIRADYQLIPVSFDDIIFIKAMADYVVVKTTSGKHMTLCTMKEMEENLPRDRFARAHRSFIVNLEKVSFIRGNNIEIVHHEFRYSIPIGRAYKKDFKQSLQAA